MAASAGDVLQLTDMCDIEPGIGRHEKIIARRASRPQR
jgi:hypothetical protein